MKIYSENILTAPDTENVCWCSGVTKGEVLKQVALGARSLEDIKKATGACTIARCQEKNPRGR